MQCPFYIICEYEEINKGLAPEFENVPEGFNLVVYRGNSKKSVFTAKFSLEIIFDEPVMR